MRMHGPSTFVSDAGFQIYRLAANVTVMALCPHSAPLGRLTRHEADTYLTQPTSMQDNPDAAATKIRYHGIQVLAF